MSVLQLLSSCVVFTAAKATGSPGRSDQSMVVSWRMPARGWDRRCDPAAARLHGATLD